MNMTKLRTIGCVSIIAAAMLTGCKGSDDASDKGKTSVDITLEEVMEANRTENLRKHYDNFRISMEDDEAAWKYYVNQDYVFYEDGSISELTTDTCKFGKYTRFVTGFLFIEEEQDNSWYDNLLFDAEYAEYEELVDCVKDGDTLLLTSQIPTKQFVKLVGHKAEGDYILMEYRLDPDTYAIEEFTETIMHSNNTTTISLKTTVEYDTDCPEMATTLYQHATQTDNLRTVTVVVAPDTSQEKSYSIQVPKGDDVKYAKPDKYKKMYADRACTKDLPDTIDLKADATYYIPGE